MSKTPPSRRGITFEVGAALEARDSLRNWYAANIEKIDYDDEKILIHYRQWSHRYDEWFDWASPYLRPMERVQLRREGRQEDGFIPGFQINDKVLASWSDCRFYPAKVLSVNKDGSYTVKFYDGVIQRVKGIHVKPFIREKRKKLTDKNGERAHVKTKKIEENEESGGPEVSLNTLSSTNGVPNEDEPGLSGLNEDKTEQTQSRVQDCDVKHQNGHHQDPEIISVKEENDILEQIEQHNYSKSFLKKYPEAEETEVENLVEYKSAIDFQEKTLKRNENEEAEVQVKQNKEDIKRDASLPHARKPQRQQIRRKKKASVGRKRSKKNRIDDKSSNNECISSISSHKALQPIVSDLLQPSTTIPSSQSQANIFKSAVRKQSHQNPNRFSREPLYRVIRNQPPPLLSINLDHNLYKCSSAGCGKSFRKAKLLEYHRKYYHRDHSEEASRMKTISKPMTFNHQEGFKRKRIKPSCVTGLQGHVRCFSSERSRENVLNVQKNVRKEKERRLLYMEALNERDLPEKKQSENVMHIKLKKKMRTTTSDEESASDWSSDSSEWSEDEPGMDVDVMSSSVSASSVASTTGSPETVRCVCEVEEENDFMLQCEDCLYWQHGTCMGLLEENVPEHYVCFICRESSGGMKLQSRGLQYWYDGDWLHSGCMYGLSFLENYSQQNSMKIAATHQLLGDVQHVGEVINGLQLKISVLQSQTHPDLRFWSQPWKPSERARKTNTALSEYQPGSTPFPDERSNKETFISAFQDYISSEHCYQKPQTLHQAQKTRANSVLHYSERPSFLKVSSNGKGIKDECDVSDGSKEQQWRINLLEHIETVQDQVSHRMDFIEKELDVLENWLDCTGELEPPEPLDRLPELKQSIKQLLVELGKIQQIALSCAT